MVKRVQLKSHEYHDSVRLMQVAETIRRAEDIQEAILMMATANNKKLLDVAGLLVDEVRAAGVDDLVIVVVADSDDAAERALVAAEQLLTETTVAAGTVTHRSLESALNSLPQANLALISVPGEYAASEARRALEHGLHVLLFSDNVPIEDEAALKGWASERGLLVMGPDCGTAIVHGVGLAFANAVSRGSVGIVGAAGTGIQEISVVLDRLGAGVSHAIGTGGRDLRSAVGGITTLMALDLLAADPDTRAVVVVAKPPDPGVARRVLEKAGTCGKPVVACFLGSDPALASAVGVVPARTLEEAAYLAARLAGTTDTSDAALQTQHLQAQQVQAREAGPFAAGQRYLRGLYSGGTLCYEAMILLNHEIGDIYSNTPLEARLRLPDPWCSQRHTLVDLGDDEFTQGRAHPMIDATVRNQRLLREAEDPEVAVLLLDVVLGFGAHESPAEGLAETIRRARASASAGGRSLAIVAYVCGTEADPQQRSRQEALLAQEGVRLASTNAEAARMAAAIVRTMEA